MNLRTLLLGFLVFLIGSEVLHARSYRPKKSSFYATFYSDNARDINANTGLDLETNNPIYRLELGVRWFDSLFFTGYYGITPSQQDKYHGFGLKFNTPGFFFIGGKSREMRAKGRHRPINTALYAAFLSHETYNPLFERNERYFENTLGFQIDLFLFSSFYMSIDVSGHTNSGDYRIHNGIGLGYEF